MPNENKNQQPAISPKLKRLQMPEQNATRNFLRIFGPLIFGAGLLCVIVGVINFFIAMGGDSGPPKLFWLILVGMPLMFVGGVMSQFGFLGALTRYVAGEGAPVAADTANYLADETKGAVETVAKSAAKGIVEGIEAGKAASGNNFCSRCGTSVKTDFKFCPKCGEKLSDD